MVMLNKSGTWNSDHEKAFRQSHPEVDRDEVPANGNPSFLIEGNANCMTYRDANKLAYCKTFGDGPR
jgi:hypothetical protein